jgi:23S rRNA pseudouridine1911/1915/1917 synthase
LSLDILYEDNHLLVVDKPAGILVQGASAGEASLLDFAKTYRKRREHKPGNVYVGVVHRLDRPVTGLVVLAKTSRSASRLSEQFRRGQVEKRYLAVVERPTSASSTSGVWESRLSIDKGADPWQDRAVGATSAPVRLARTHWRRLAAGRWLWLLELAPETGRRHQLRAQCSAHEMPIYGDAKYGSKHAFGRAIALHAYQITFRHPTRDETIRFVCPPPESWSRFPFRFPCEVKPR